MDIVLITSIIDTKNTPLSYTKTRSVFSKEERYIQTKKTIESLRKIPNKKIILIECSQLKEEEKEFFMHNTNYFINLFELNDDNIKNRINSPSKSLGEGTMTIYALDYLFKNNINFKNLYKISGRYWLNDKFDYSKFNNDLINVQYEEKFTATVLYKLPYFISKLWYSFLLNSMDRFLNCEGYEQIFSSLINQIEKDNKSLLINTVPLGLSGHISVCGGYLEC